jgi:hypothetical protein
VKRNREVQQAGGYPVREGYVAKEIEGYDDGVDGIHGDGFPKVQRVHFVCRDYTIKTG